MSNIFDALNKRDKERPPKKPRNENLKPLEPAGAPTPLSPAGETDRDLDMERLRQRVLLELGPVSTASILFAGSVEGEGSTTLSLLFAREVAHSEQRPVLLIDGDIEGYPRTLTGAMKSEGPSHKGFTDLLVGNAKLSECLLGTELSNLHFMPRGSDYGSAMDVIKGTRVQDLIDEAVQHYAYVVLDGPPLLDSPETTRLASATDGVVVVVRAHRTRREVVQRGLRGLQQANCRVLGAVLNERRYPIPSFLYRRL